MGLLSRFKRSKDKKNSLSHPPNGSYAAAVIQPYFGPDQTIRLPDAVLWRILEQVCPHAVDESLNSSEDSGNDGCMSCDTRELAHCARTNRKWYSMAAGLLYNSIRIDAVHYCEIEEEYAERRRKARHHSRDDTDAPALRLRQLCNSVKDNLHLGQRVRFIKLPYMTREACKADIARLVSGCPNLAFVDLPDGFFNGDMSCQLLRQELQARCPHIQKMKYNQGGEQALEHLLHGHWQEMHSLELNKVYIEPSIVRQVFGMLPRLNELILHGITWMNDTFFQTTPGLPSFPALQTLTLDHIHHVTAEGVARYLSSPMCSDRLRTLNIKSCHSILVSSLHYVLQAGTGLKTLEYMTTVTAPLPLDPLPPLASNTLLRLNYEIISNSANHVYPPAASHYHYLAKSLTSNCLPALRQLYVCDPDFPEVLTLAPPVRPFSEAPPPLFNQPLEVYSKGPDELEWIFTSMIPPEVTGRRASLAGGRPLSSYSAHKGLGPQWEGGARRSVVVPNGFGGFLAVPADDGRPKSEGAHYPPSGRFGHGHSQSCDASLDLEPPPSLFTHAGRERRASRADLWR